MSDQPHAGPAPGWTWADDTKPPPAAPAGKEPDTYWGGFWKGLKEGAGGGASGLIAGLKDSPGELWDALKSNFTDREALPEGASRKEIVEALGKQWEQQRGATLPDPATDPEAFGHAVGSQAGQILLTDAATRGAIAAPGAARAVARSPTAMKVGGAIVGGAAGAAVGHPITGVAVGRDLGAGLAEAMQPAQGMPTAGIDPRLVSGERMGAADFMASLKQLSPAQQAEALRAREVAMAQARAAAPPAPGTMRSGIPVGPPAAPPEAPSTDVTARGSMAEYAPIDAPVAQPTPRPAMALPTELTEDLARRFGMGHAAPEPPPAAPAPSAGLPTPEDVAADVAAKNARTTRARGGTKDTGKGQPVPGAPTPSDASIAARDAFKAAGVDIQEGELSGAVYQIRHRGKTPAEAVAVQLARRPNPPAAAAGELASTTVAKGGTKVKKTSNIETPASASNALPPFVFDQRAGDTVAGLKVSKDVPNLSSIESSFNEGEYTVEPGVRQLSMEGWNPTKTFANAADVKRADALAGDISRSKTIKPLIVGVGTDGEPYIIEGNHRLHALGRLGADSFPAIVVRETP